MTQPLLKLEAISRFYPPQTIALDQASLILEAASTVAIVGPSGSGKSTLLTLLGLLDRPTSGTYELLGEDVSKFGDTERAKLRRDHFGFVFQAFHLIEYLTVRENVEHGLELAGWPANDIADTAQEALVRVGLEHRLDARTTTLSGGEQQRVAVARALARRPKILLCDEPTGNLDTENSEAVLELLLEQARHGSCVVIVTHDDDIAEQCERVVRLRDGHIIAVNDRREALA